LEALSTALSRALTLHEVARVSVEHLVRNADAEAGACLLADEARGDLVVEYAAGEAGGAGGRWVRGQRLALDAAGPPGEAVGARRRVVRRTVGDVWEVAVPIVFGDAALGCFELRFAPAQAPSAAALEAAGRMVERCTQAIARARLFDREHDVAQTLQRSLLPGGLPVIDGIEIDARFRPAGMGTIVGGDFYDVIVLDDTSLVLVVGDVCGKGARAAAATQLVRYAIRAEAQTTREPAALLARLDAALTAELYDSDRFVTVGCASCTLGDGKLDVRLSLAGTPPPLVTRSNGGCVVVGRPGPVVGIGLRRFREDRLTLSSGEALVLYTDGLTDAQAPHRIDDPADLCQVLDGRADRPAGLAARLDALLEHAAGSPDMLPRDDIAILGVRVT
jgi:serine phosphatase RsbU (regulator of sigma subunit)